MSNEKGLSFGKRTELKSEGNETSHRVPFYFKRKVEFVTVQKKKEEKVSFDPSFPQRRRSESLHLSVVLVCLQVG